MKIIKLFIFFLLINLCVQPNDIDENKIATIIAIEGLNIREESSSESKKIGGIPFGSIVDLVDIDSDSFSFKHNSEEKWYKVKYKNITGWVFGKYLIFGNYADNISKIYKDYINGKYGKLLILKEGNIKDDIPNLEGRKIIYYSKFASKCYSEYSYTDTKISFLKNFQLDYKSQERIVDNVTNYDSIGSYTIDNKTIKLNLISGDIDLIWIKEINGFIKKSYYEAFKNKKVAYNPEKHWINYPESILQKYKCETSIGQPLNSWSEIGVYHFQSK